MSEPLRPAERAYALAVGAAFVLAVASPAFRDPPRDSFPLSDYPMFSKGRPYPDLELAQALGVRADGTRAPLSPSVAADTLEVLQARVAIAGAVAGGPEASARFCADVARRVREQGEALRDVVAVELATSRFHVIDYFEREPAPIERTVHARCEVGPR